MLPSQLAVPTKLPPALLVQNRSAQCAAGGITQTASTSTRIGLIHSCAALIPKGACGYERLQKSLRKPGGKVSKNLQPSQKLISACPVDLVSTCRTLIAL